MEPQELKSKLHGVIGFPVTPFHKDLSLDAEGLRRNVQFMAKHPMCALVAAGGTGEVYSLTPAEHHAVVQTTVEAAGRIPVIAGVGVNPHLAAELARQSQAAGASGILMLPSYYINAHDDGLLDYYATIAAATPLGHLIYSRDWVNLTSAMVERLAARIPNLVALKDGQGDLRALQRIKNRVGDRLEWIGGIGDDMVPGYYSLGIRTYTSSISAIAPRLSLQLHERASALDMASLHRLMTNYVIPLYNIRSRKRGYEVSVMKACMQILGMPAGPVRPPLTWIRPEEENELRSLMERYKPVLSEYS
ncbi:MAG: 5-dehydro-4-deoxyglucarate dehydratase [Acidobacteria bacterium]|nr:5-dehydro-4-deoxyglucarate dehydratase [Acidobacteriota bacterium]